MFPNPPRPNDVCERDVLVKRVGGWRVKGRTGTLLFFFSYSAIISCWCFLLSLLSGAALPRDPAEGERMFPAPPLPVECT